MIVALVNYGVVLSGAYVGPRGDFGNLDLENFCEPLGRNLRRRIPAAHEYIVGKPLMKGKTTFMLSLLCLYTNSCETSPFACVGEGKSENFKAP